jgi:hypothetical protein
MVGAIMLALERPHTKELSKTKDLWMQTWNVFVSTFASYCITQDTIPILKYVTHRA